MPKLSCYYSGYKTITSCVSFCLLLAANGFGALPQTSSAANLVNLNSNFSTLPQKNSEQIDKLSSARIISNVQSTVDPAILAALLAATTSPRITFNDSGRSLCYYRNNFFEKNIRASYTALSGELDSPLISKFGDYFLDSTLTGSQTLTVKCDGFTYELPITLPDAVTGSVPDVQLPNKPPVINSFQAKVGGNPIIGATKNTSVTLVVNATDPNNDKLTYTWGSNAGSITNINGNFASWKLPNSTGLNFAYVLVSDGKGGYKESSLTVSTDAGTVAAPAPVIPAAKPSDNLPLVDHFLTFFSTKNREVYLPIDSLGADTKMGSCRYYEAIKVVGGCDAQGNMVSQKVNFASWKQKWGLNGTETKATYVNISDLNLERDMHGIGNTSGTAFYVCNYPRNSESNTNVDLSNAFNNKNLVACVAMEYSVTPGVNANQPFTKFITFAPSGKLLQSVNLDGRGEKYMPGSCVVCHGAANDQTTFPPSYPEFNRFSENGTTSPNLKAQFIPFDLNNFRFSPQAGFTRIDLQPALRTFNKLILNTNPNPAVAELINGWYPLPLSFFNGTFIPAGWVGHETVYNNVVKPYCRACHITMDPNSGLNFQTFTEFNDKNFELSQRVCGNTAGVERKRYSMPNALTTFDLFWNNTAARSTLLQHLIDQGEIVSGDGQTCDAP